MRRRGATLALLLLWSAVIAPAMALAADAPPAAAAAPRQMPPGQASDAALVLGGLGFGTVGFLAGAVIGASAGHREDDVFSGLAAGYYVGSTLGALGLAGGMELVNHGRGDGWLVALTSLGVGAAGYGALLAAKEWTVLPLTVIAQLGLAAAVERATAERNLRAGETGAAAARGGAAGSLTLVGGPAPDGFGLAVRGRF